MAFWQTHVQAFRSPKAYALLVEALLKRGDLVAAMALLVHWLSQAEEIPLAENGHSFHVLAIRWMGLLWENQGSPRSLTERWSLARKLLDYMEANADAYWQAPHLELAGAADEGPDEDQEDGADGEDGLFSAAYENVTYRDTSDDGFEGEMLEGGMPTTDLELSRETERIAARLAFLSTVARLWKQTAVASSRAEGSAAVSGPAAASGPAAGPALPSGHPLPGRDDVLAGWLGELAQRRRQLGELLAAVHRHRIPAPRDARIAGRVRSTAGDQGNAPGADYRRERRDARRRVVAAGHQRPAGSGGRPGSVGDRRSSACSAPWSAVTPSASVPTGRA